MDSMAAIASTAMEMSAQELAINYSMSLSKNVMDNQEAMAQQMLEMLPPAPPLGEFIDTYA